MTTHLCPPCFVRTGQLGLALGMLVLTFFSRLAAAQTGALNLNVVDQDRRVVLGATVVVEDSKHHARRVVATGGERQIVVSLPAPDTYDMVVTADGFADFEQQGITIEAGSTVELSVQMSIALAKEVVTISTGVEGLRDRLNVAEVRENSARDVGEALSHLEGFSKVRRGGIASDIVLRGFQRDNLNVLIDGSRIYGACPNRMDPVAYHIDFAEVGRIEVLKGAVDMSSSVSTILRSPLRMAGRIPSCRVGTPFERQIHIAPEKANALRNTRTT